MRLNLTEKKALCRTASLYRLLGSDLLTNDEDREMGRKLEAKGLVTLEQAGGSYLSATLTEEGAEKAAKVRKQVQKVLREERLAKEKQEREEALKHRPCLVDIMTGERVYGEPGMSEDTLFGLLANGMLD